MDENTTVQTGTEELPAETLAAFDEGWDDLETPVETGDAQDDGDLETEETENDLESEGTDADADQQEAEGNEGGEDGEAPESESSGDEGENPDQGESFLLKHLGEERKVSRDEVVQLAQKGLDYDRIREKWDSVKDDVPRLRSYEKFLAELASSRGGDIEALMDETMTQILINRAKAKGEELNPSAAAAQAVRMRMQNGWAPAAEETEAGAKGNLGADGGNVGRPAVDANEMVNRFLAEYPTVRAENIPKEVWDEVNRNGGDLVKAYRGFENKRLAEENKRLKKDLEDAKQQQKNKERSTGSTKSVGSSSKRSAFDEGWDAEF